MTEDRVWYEEVSDGDIPTGDREELEFFAGNEVRLGDAIKTTTRFLGIKPCEACDRRAVWLNRWRLPWRRH